MESDSFYDFLRSFPAIMGDCKTADGFQQEADPVTEGFDPVITDEVHGDGDNQPKVSAVVPLCLSTSPKKENEELLETCDASKQHRSFLRKEAVVSKSFLGQTDVLKPPPSDLELVLGSITDLDEESREALRKAVKDVPNLLELQLEDIQAFGIEDSQAVKINAAICQLNMRPWKDSSLIHPPAVPWDSTKLERKSPGQDYPQGKDVQFHQMPIPDFSYMHLGAQLRNLNMHMKCMEATLFHTRRILGKYSKDDWQRLGYNLNENRTQLIMAAGNLKSECGYLSAKADGVIAALRVQKVSEKNQNPSLKLKILAIGCMVAISAGIVFVVRKVKLI